MPFSVSASLFPFAETSLISPVFPQEQKANSITETVQSKRIFFIILSYPIIPIIMVNNLIIRFTKLIIKLSQFIEESPPLPTVTLRICVS